MCYEVIFRPDYFRYEPYAGIDLWEVYVKEDDSEKLITRIFSTEVVEEMLKSMGVNVDDEEIYYKLYYQGGDIYVNDCNGVIERIDEFKRDDDKEKEKEFNYWYNYYNTEGIINLKKCKNKNFILLECKGSKDELFRVFDYVDNMV